MVLSVMITVFLLSLCLLSTKGQVQDQKNDRLDQIRGTKAVSDKAENKKTSIKQLKEDIKKKQEAKLLEKQLSGKKDKNKVLESQLLMADLPLGCLQFYLIRLGSGVVLGAIGFLALTSLELEDRLKILIGLAGFILGLLMPQKLLESKVKQKQDTYRLALPDIMDLLVVSVEAGLGFDAALIRLYEKDKSPLMEELMRAVSDIQHGMSKKDAYTNMSKRCQVKEITSFLNALLQAEQMGISIKSVLKSQADNLREDRRQAAEEKALKAPVTMLIPLVVFIFPVIFIVLLGPAVMNIMEVFA